MKSEGTEMREILALVEADYKMVILRKYEVMIWENRVNVGQKKLVNYIAEEDLSDVLSHMKSCYSERDLGWQKYGRKQSVMMWPQREPIPRLLAIDLPCKTI